MKFFDIKDFAGLREIDVFGLMHDYKKVISTGISAAFWHNNLKKTFIKYGLKFDILDESFDYQRRSKTCVISKKTAYLKEVKKAYKLKRFDIVGYYLGYPRCCVEFYRRQKDDRGNFNFTYFVRNIYKNSHNNFWKLNNILNFDGRLTNSNALSKEFLYFTKSSRFISLISHSPCSYDCRESLKIADMNYRCYSFYSFSDLDSLTILTKPILYIDDSHFIFFDGKSQKSSIQYRNVLLSIGLKKLKAYLLKGNGIKIENNFVTVFKAKKIIGRVRYNKPLVLPFDKKYD